MTLINPQESADVNISLSGASFLTGEIKANSITAYLDGASNASLNGIINNINVNASGASLLSTFTMITQDARLQLSGASQTSLTVNGNIDLVASGASVLTYKGTASISHLDLSGASQIVKIN